jgi:hypothetical protein
MSSVTREQRRAQLRELRRSDPARLIALYRQASSLDDLTSLPPGVTFASMIETVINYEIATGKSPNEN